MEKKKCPECGQEIDETVMICPYCGYTVQKISERSEQAKKIQNKGRILLVIACALMIAAFFKVDNKTYTFYKEHYQECMEGYAENKNSAEMYTGGMFKSYNNEICGLYYSKSFIQGAHKVLDTIYTANAGQTYIPFKDNIHIPTFPAKRLVVPADTMAPLTLNTHARELKWVLKSESQHLQVKVMLYLVVTI